MTTPYSQLTSPNQPIGSARSEAVNGIRYAYRHFGAADTGNPPLLFLQHSRGNLDG